MVDSPRSEEKRIEPVSPPCAGSADPGGATQAGFAADRPAAGLLALLSVGHMVVDINQGALPAILPFLREAFALSRSLDARGGLVIHSAGPALAEKGDVSVVGYDAASGAGSVLVGGGKYFFDGPTSLRSASQAGRSWNVPVPGRDTGVKRAGPHGRGIDAG